MKTDRASFPDRFHIDNAAPQRCVPSFSYIPSLGITAGRCSSAGLLPRQHQDPHDTIVWVLVSYRSREQELLSIVHCGTKLFVCFFNFQMRQNEGDDSIQRKRNDEIYDLQHRDAGFGLDSQRTTKVMSARLPITLLTGISAPRSLCKNGQPMCHSSICLGAGAIFLRFWI